MSKAFRVFGLAGFMAIAGLGVAMAANDYTGICNLIRELAGLLSALKVLAFVGAAFVLAAWAWDLIKGGGDEKTKLLEDAKKRGVTMLVGFALLMLVGFVIQYLPGFAGCTAEDFSGFNKIELKRSVTPAGGTAATTGTTP